MPDTKLPVTGGLYNIDFGSSAKGTFTSCEGLEAKTSVVEHKASGAQGKPVAQYLPGPMEGGTITLTRAVHQGDKQFTTWHKESKTGKRTNGTVQVCDIKGVPVVTFSITNAWASTYSLNRIAATSELLEEKVTVVHEGVEVQ